MGIKEKIQDRKERRERRHAHNQRMAAASIRRMQAEQAAREIKHRWYMASSGNKAAEAEHFAKVGENLKDLDDHLLMVTNFGSSSRQAEKIAEAMKKAGIPLDTPIGISTHEHMQRPELHYEESADALIQALREAGFTNSPKEREIAGLYTETGDFSSSIAVGANQTLHWYSQAPWNVKSPQEALHIAVVSSLDTDEVGIPKSVSINGTANLYRGVVPETGLPVWNQIADSWY